MKITDLEELQEKIDSDFAWRKKELTLLKSNVMKSKSFAKDTAIRSGVALLYAHWEGLVKNVAMYYLCFISYQKYLYKDLKPNFLAISIKKEFERFQDTKKTSLHTEIINKVFEIQSQESKIPYDKVIKTDSNLKSDVFKEIMASLALEIDEFELSFALIDENLLRMRNFICHGERLEQIDLDENKYIEMHDKIRILMEKFVQHVMDAAINNYYLKDAT